MPRLLPVALLALCLAGCASTDGASSDVDSEPVTTERGLLDRLSARGLVLVPDGAAAFRSLYPSRSYRLESAARPGRIDVYQFDNAAAAERALTSLQAESRGRTDREYFLSGPLVVYFQGRNSSLRSALVRALGSPRTDT